MEKKDYIKCLNKSNLINFLKEEKYTVEAEILKPRDIDGIRFLELTELDLIRWGLTPKQKKLLLNCRNKISVELYQQSRKPSLPQKPQLANTKLTSVNKIAKKLETNINFTSNLNENSSLNPALNNSFKSNYSVRNNAKNANLDSVQNPNGYIDMTKKSLQPESNQSVNSNYPPTGVTTYSKPNLVTRNSKFNPTTSKVFNLEPNSNKLKTNIVDDKGTNKQNLTETSDLDYEAPKFIAENQIFVNTFKLPEKPATQFENIKQSNTICSISNRVKSNAVVINKYQHPLPKPPADEPNKSAHGMNVTRNTTQTQDVLQKSASSVENDEMYEDPDQIEKNQLGTNKNGQNLGSEKYGYKIHLDPIRDLKMGRHPSTEPRPPKLPPRYLQQTLLRNESRKYTSSENRIPIHNNVHQADNFYEVEPIPELPIYEDEPLNSNSKIPKGYDNYRLSGLPPRKVNTDQNTQCNFKSIINQQGSIWNISEANELPKPPLFEKKFEQIQLNIVKKLNEDEKTETSEKKFNPNDCPYYRNTDRKGARLLLEKIPNLTDGAFLFRNSTEYFLVITMCYRKHYYDVGVYRDPKNQTFYCETKNEGQITSFKTLNQFVEYYKKHPLIVLSKGIEIKIYLQEQLPPDLY